MIKVTHYDKHGRNIGERTFESVGVLAAYYRNRKHPDLPEQPEDGCWNCLNYDPGRGACTLSWNNGDDKYYNPDLDDKDPDDWCNEHETDPDAEWEGE